MVVQGEHSTGGTRITLYWWYQAYTLLVVQGVHTTRGTRRTLYWKYKAFALLEVQRVHSTGGTRRTLCWWYKAYTLLVVQKVHSTGGTKSTLYWRYKEYTLLEVVDKLKTFFLASNHSETQKNQFLTLVRQEKPNSIGYKFKGDVHSFFNKLTRLKIIPERPMALLF